MIATPDGLLVLDMVPHAFGLQLAPEITPSYTLVCDRLDSSSEILS